MIVIDIDYRYYNLDVLVLRYITIFLKQKIVAIAYKITEKFSIHNETHSQ